MNGAEKTRRRVVIAGGSGFLGLNLADFLSTEAPGGPWEIVIVSRTQPAQRPGKPRYEHAAWDGRTVGAWASALDGADAVVNLAGRTVDCIKTPDHCDEILRSRVEATLAIGEALRGVRSRPRVWVQMSTAHIYGDPPSLVCDEHSPTGYGLAPFVGRAWEEAFARSLPEDVRGVVLRTSFVLGRSGGALTVMARLARFGLGGRVARGTQGISWIHERDMNRIMHRAIVEESMRGVYVATAPEPVSHAEFMRGVRRAVGMPIGLPAPGWLVRIGAGLVLRTDPELVLYGRYCVPRRLRDEGFTFEFPGIEAALRDLLVRKPTQPAAGQGRTDSH